MQLIITGKNVEVTDWLRSYVEKKIGKLDRYLPTIDEARVELAVEKTKSAQDRQVVQVTVRSSGTILRVEEKSADMFASIDAAVDKMHRQIARYKGKQRRRGRPSPGEMPPVPVSEAEEEEPHIVRTKRFRVDRMDETEAIEQMELLGHDFFIFMNVNTDRLSVVYRRHDGDYGLLEPEVV
ncbi:MAG: ribosome-associated translation inhibitor RaiA [Chloroflexi bacterium]|nr:ribosome-associated translation inhibitor RaiA [Chloroflexota bacterium]